MIKLEEDMYYILERSIFNIFSLTIAFWITLLQKLKTAKGCFGPLAGAQSHQRHE